MSSSPTLSVFMPNYNDAASIGRAIEAVMTQSRPPDEYLILDDGSTDNSMEVIGSYIKKYPGIKLAVHRVNKGPSAVIAYALAHLKGDYIYFSSANDQILPGFLESAMDLAAKHPSAGIIMGEMIAKNAEGTVIDTIRSCRWKNALFAPPTMFLEEYLSIESATHSLSGATIYRARALHEIGGFPFDGLGCWCDSFVNRALGLKYGACYIPKPCMVWVVATDSISQSALRDPATMLAVVRNAADLMRSERFKSLFPEDHVRKWRRGYRRFVLLYHSKPARILNAIAVRLLRSRRFAGMVRPCISTLRSLVRYCCQS